MKGRAMKTDPLYLLVNSYQTISKVWLWKMTMRQILSWEVYSCILYSASCTRITNIFKHVRYSNRSNAFIQHGRFDLLLENSW